MDKSGDLLRKECRWMVPLPAVLGIAALSGFVTYWIPSHGIWQQWTYLMHVLSGLTLSILLAPYLVVHFRRTLPLRRTGVLLLGLAAAGVLLGLMGSGLHIVFFGQREALRWIYHLHILAAYLAVAAFCLHLIFHRLLLFTRRSPVSAQGFATISPAALRVGLVGALAAVVAVLLPTALYSRIPPTYQSAPAIQPYQLSYGRHPFRPSQTETTSGGFLDPRQIAGSKRCGSCHPQIVEEWRDSIHSQAASDKAYQTNINLLATKKGMAATRYCEGCHAPVALLSGQLTAGGRLNTPGHMEEGVNCLACHGIDKLMHLQGVGSYRLAPPSDYLFADREGLLQTRIHNFLIRIHPQEHRRNMGRPVLHSPQLCAACHAQFMDKEMNGWGWVKMQDEYIAWLNSPYSGLSEQTFSHQKMTRCQDCHMTLVPSEDPSADREGRARSHRMPGANTAIPWVAGRQEQLRLVTKFLQEDKVRIDIEEPIRPDAPRSAVYHRGQELFSGNESPAYFYLGERETIRVIVINSQVGHNFPGGTIDINEAWIDFRVVDAQNHIVYESGRLLEDGTVDPNAYIYQSIPIDREGQHVWKHDLFNMIGDSYRKVIRPRGADLVEYTFEVPYWVKGPLTVSAVMKYRKFNNRYARFALKDDHIQLPIVDMARDAITIPVRYKPEKETAFLPPENDSTSVSRRTGVPAATGY